MKSTLLKSCTVLAIFLAIYLLWAAFLPPFKQALGAELLPGILHPPQSFLLIPAEGAAFGCACVAAFWSQLSRGKRMMLVIVGALANSLVYCVAIWAFFFGLAALVAVVILGSVGFFIFLRRIVSSTNIKKSYVLAVALISALSIILPSPPSWSPASFIVAKALWWVAVLGVCVASLSGEWANHSFEADGAAAAQLQR